MYTLRAKLIIVGLLVVIAASAVSVGGHIDVLWSGHAPIQTEILAPRRSLEVQKKESAPVEAPVIRNTQALSASNAQSITLVVGDRTYRAVATSTQTILSVMRILEEASDFSFAGKDFPGMGFFVEEIDHKRNANGYYWMLYVNMLAAPKGVSQMIVSPGDQILWRYESR